MRRFIRGHAGLGSSAAAPRPLALGVGDPRPRGLVVRANLPIALRLDPQQFAERGETSQRQQ